MSRYRDADLLTREQAAVLAGQVRRLRKVLGWSQERLSRESGVPQPVISHLESRHCRPQVTSAGKLAAALGAPLEGLVGTCGHCQGKPGPWMRCMGCGAEGERP